MLILALRTDKPEAELGVYEADKQLAHETWQAHRELAETMHHKLEQILNKLSISINSLEGIVVYEGPGSFTGLRIGITVANTLSYALAIPIVGSTGNDWLETGIQKLNNGKNDRIVVPQYGADPHITKPRK